MRRAAVKPTTTTTIPDSRAFVSGVAASSDSHQPTPFSDPGLWLYMCKRGMYNSHHTKNRAPARSECQSRGRHMAGTRRRKEAPRAMPCVLFPALGRRPSWHAKNKEKKEIEKKKKKKKGLSSVVVVKPAALCILASSRCAHIKTCRAPRGWRLGRGTGASGGSLWMVTTGEGPPFFADWTFVPGERKVVRGRGRIEDG
ncbi:hypothetical protein LY76DRAFT_417509 [Colletotrichum caudatum]|nr:hypothetical protein LY76DRAFT_417509 [Colletotrichum caudatum]